MIPWGSNAFNNGIQQWYSTTVFNNGKDIADVRGAFGASKPLGSLSFAPQKIKSTPKTWQFLLNQIFDARFSFLAKF
jgi:hypothetical protein